MKRIPLKLIALLLAFLFVLSGCSSAEKNGTEADSSSSEAVTASETGGTEADSGSFSFTTVDINGKEVKFEDFGSSKIILVNLWEPWCGPCCAELGDLEKLFETYKDKGLMVIGAFSSADMDEEVKALADENGISYPFVRSTADFLAHATDYVPTSFIVDASGKLLTEEPIVGSNSFEQWEAVVLPYLG